MERANEEFAKQNAEYRQKLRLFEMENTRLVEEAIRHKYIIRAQQVAIEQFINKTSVNLNALLQDMVSGSNRNLTLLTDYGQKMVQESQDLLIHLPGRSISEAPPKVTVRAQGSRRPLEPVVAPQVSEEERVVLRETEVHEEKELDTDAPAQNFVTERRHRGSSRSLEPCNPVTLEDGMLSTIPETSLDGVINVSAVDEVVESDEEPENVSMRSHEENHENMSLRSHKESQMNISTRSRQENQENISLNVEEPVEFVPTKRRRQHALEPLTETVTRRSRRKVVTLEEEHRISLNECPILLATPKCNTKRTRSPSRRTQTSIMETSVDDEVSRPRRRAAPENLTEPSLRRKMRQ